MSHHKSIGYKEDELLISRYAKALGHPARIAILKFLAHSNACFCGEIVDVLPIAQATVSQHLKELKNAGLIQGSIEPPKVKYCIDPENWKKAKKLFDNFLEKSVNSPC
jgi:ArsR family transcriptional regulator